MSPDLVEQSQKLLRDAGNILVVFKNNLSGDCLSASLALSESLKKINKNVSVVSTHAPGAKFSFLSQAQHVKTNLASSEGKLAVKIVGGKDKVDEFWYEQSGDDVFVYIGPKKGAAFKHADVETFIQGTKFDLLVSVGVANLELLGELYEKNTAVFFETPKLNIDISSANAGYGNVNLIDLTAASNCEIIFEIIENLSADVPTPEIATLILTGIIAKTDSFQSIKTNPRSFFTASKLLEFGASLQQIVKHLYKTKTMGLLKLWGRALAKLDLQPELGMVSSFISFKDFADAGASENDVRQVLEELIGSLSDARIILFIAETEPLFLQGMLYIKPQLNLEGLITELRGEKLGGGFVTFSLPNIDLEKGYLQTKNLIINWLKPGQSV